MQPILEDRVDYFQKNIGLGKSATARLLQDSIEIVDSVGSPIVSIPLSAITGVKHVKGGVIRIYVGEQMHGLQFMRMPYRLFGLLGLMLSGAGKKAKEWSAQLSGLGFQVKEKIF